MHAVILLDIFEISEPSMLCSDDKILPVSKRCETHNTLLPDTSIQAQYNSAVCPQLEWKKVCITLHRLVDCKKIHTETQNLVLSNPIGEIFVLCVKATFSTVVSRLGIFIILRFEDDQNYHKTVWLCGSSTPEQVQP